MAELGLRCTRVCVRVRVGVLLTGWTERMGADESSSPTVQYVAGLDASPESMSYRPVATAVSESSVGTGGGDSYALRYRPVSTPAIVSSSSSCPASPPDLHTRLPPPNCASPFPSPSEGVANRSNSFVSRQEPSEVLRSDSETTNAAYANL